MSSDRKTLLKKAQRGQQIVIASIRQENALPIFLELDISMAQFKGLLTLAHTPRGSVSQFAERLHIGRSAASLLIDRLVQDGLVERTEDSGDRRKMVLCLSSRGEELIEQFHQGKAESNPLTGWLEQMSEKDLQAFAQGIDALASIAQTATGITEPCQCFSPEESTKEICIPSYPAE